MGEFRRGEEALVPDRKPEVLAGLKAIGASRDPPLGPNFIPDEDQVLWLMLGGSRRVDTYHGAWLRTPSSSVIRSTGALRSRVQQKLLAGAIAGFATLQLDPDPARAQQLLEKGVPEARIRIPTRTTQNRSGAAHRRTSSIAWSRL